MRWTWLCLILAVVLGACNHSSDSSSDTSDTTAVSATSTTEDSSGGEETTEPRGSDVDACVLVDADDAARILGAPATVDTTPAPSFGETSVCAWLTGSDALLVVSLFEGRQFYGGNDLPGSEALALGDEGYIGVEPTFGGVNLQVIKGEWVLSMSAAPFAIVDVEGLPANMTAVAQQALDRLP